MATPLEANFSNLIRMRGVQGACVVFSQDLLFKDQPEGSAPVDMDELGQVIARMLLGFRHERRQPEQVYLAFAEHKLLVLFHNQSALAFLLRDEEPLAYVSKIGLAFLADNYYLIQSYDPSATGAATAASALQDGDWNAFLAQMESIMSKVLGGAQSRALIDRVMSQENLDRQSSPDFTQMQRIGELIIREVPNRGRQNALRSEMLFTLEKLRTKAS